VKSRARVNTEASAATQLAAELKWLARGHLPMSFLAMLPEPSPAERDIAERVRGFLTDPKLVPFLRLLEQHNSRPRCEPGRRTPSKTPFLLGPHLHQVLTSVQARDEVRQKFPVLDQPAAEVREHLQNVSAKCNALAGLIRKGPQPYVALAGKTNTNEALKVFAPWTELFEASDGSERQVVAFTELIEWGADCFSALAGHVRRAKQNRHTDNGALRMRAAEFLVDVFKRKLGHPYHAHVAIIAAIISGIPTDADFVKKVEARCDEPR